LYPPVYADKKVEFRDGFVIFLEKGEQNVNAGIEIKKTLFSGDFGRNWT